MLPVRNLKCLVLVFINACRLLSALPSLSQFGQGRLSLVAISFYTLSLLFGPCHLSEFTLAGPRNWMAALCTFTISLVDSKEVYAVLLSEPYGKVCLDE